MISMWEPLVQAMASFQTSSCEDKLGLVRQLEAGASLHPQHSLVTGDTQYMEIITTLSPQVLDLKLAVANKMARAPDTGHITAGDTGALGEKQVVK